MIEILQSHFRTDDDLRLSYIEQSGMVPSAGSSAEGVSWHSSKSKVVRPFVVFATGLTRERGGLARVEWWVNVLGVGAKYPRHVHAGKWTFVYYLSSAAIEIEGALLHCLPGDVVIFPSKASHIVPAVPLALGAPRVSIAGNLFF